MSYLVERDGFTIVKGVVTQRECRLLIAELGNPDGAGSRGLLALPAIVQFARSDAVMSLVASHLGSHALPVRAIFFDKSPTSNWLVPWHQDVTIAVASKVDVPGFGPWSVKNGIPHVQPPEELLARMIAVRLHLDACDSSNGALRVIPGSHQIGRLGTDQIAAARSSSAEVICEASAGDILLMRPLLLHASSKSCSDRRRRILHVEYCSDRLPIGMTWHDAA